MTSTLLQEKARELLDQNEVSLVIGYGEFFRRANDKSLQQIISPIFISKPDEVTSLTWNEHCVYNLSTYLIRKEIKAHRRIALLAKGCDIESICVLIQENQIKRNDLVIIGLTCQGVVGNSSHGYAKKCYSCQHQTPHIYDILIPSQNRRHQLMAPHPLPSPLGGEGRVRGVPSGRTHAPVKGKKVDGAGSGSRQEKWQGEIDHLGQMDMMDRLDMMDRMSSLERRLFWKDQFSRCIRCYACRNVCPLCYCERCIADKSSPQWIEKGSLLGNLSFHIIRTFHLASRCTNCGECERVCPMGLPLSLLNRKMAQIVKDLFQPDLGLGVKPFLENFPYDNGQPFVEKKSFIKEKSFVKEKCNKGVKR